MLSLEIPDTTLYNSSDNTLIRIKACTLNLEHSLIAIAKWESKWHKPYFSTENMTEEESTDYIRCMTLNPNKVDPMVYMGLTNKHKEEIRKYIDDPMTASTFKDTKAKDSKEFVTNETIYYWMTQLQIPFECDKWHYNRLMALIRMCSSKNSPQKKMTQKEIMAENAKQNAIMRAKIAAMENESK